MVYETKGFFTKPMPTHRCCYSQWTVVFCKCFQLKCLLSRKTDWKQHSFLLSGRINQVMIWFRMWLGRLYSHRIVSLSTNESETYGESQWHLSNALQPQTTTLSEIIFVSLFIERKCWDQRGWMTADCAANDFEDVGAVLGSNQSGFLRLSKSTLKFSDHGHYRVILISWQDTIRP